MNWLLQVLLSSLDYCCIRETAISTTEVSIYRVPVVCQSRQPGKSGIIPVCQVRGLGLYKVKKPAQSNRDSKHQHRDLMEGNKGEKKRGQLS